MNYFLRDMIMEVCFKGAKDEKCVYKNSIDFILVFILLMGCSLSKPQPDILIQENKQEKRLMWW